MSGSTAKSRGLAVCPRCGAPLRADAPEGLCTACLLEAGAETIGATMVDSGVTRSSAADVDTVSSAPRGATTPSDVPRLQMGDRLGHYVIGRLLGRGGMGEVYEAEQTTSGRRVALKILRGRLHRASERARFLREGQLAASVSHPHTVYIFGSEEIGSVPVIAMELLPGGTLKDRVASGGPMAPADAVSAVLDVIGGLDAAAAAGILHRDIKPSNCFIDRDGAVKIGDFGLSISTMARDVRHELSTSSFEGTPQFAPPEQLRGEPLDVRADIYAVGATLYYLLTGRPPFDAPDMRQLMASVTAEMPLSPRRWRSGVPPRLAGLVLQCLAKQPGDRPASYAALADALRPFASRDETPAQLGPRLVAWLLDTWVIVALPVAFVATVVVDPISGSPRGAAMVAAWAWLANFFYYFVLEATRGASFGKQVLGLRVRSADGGAPSWPQVLLRTTVYHAPDLLMMVYLLGNAPTGSAGRDVAPAVLIRALWVALFFSTARRGNGWRGLHEVVSGTRVAARDRVLSRLRTIPKAASSASFEHGRRLGPFVVEGGVDISPDTLVRAFDPVLRRPVWIQIVAAGTPAIDAARRDVSRVSRLHWLTGHRGDETSWDAYEAPSGHPIDLTSLRGDEWPLLKRHLLELADELIASAADGTRPVLALDRLWQREDGVLVLLDFRAPGAMATAPLTAEALIAELAARIPVDPARPELLPLSARVLRDRWRAAPPMSLGDARSAIAEAAAAPERVDTWRRAVPLAVTAAPVALMLVVGVLIMPALQRFGDAGTSRMMNMLGALRAPTPPPNSPLRLPGVREAIEVSLAGHYGAAIRDDQFWNTGIVRSLAPDFRARAEEILRRHPAVSAEEMVAADGVLASVRGVRAPAGARREVDVIQIGGVIISFLTALALALVVTLSVGSALVVPGGLLVTQLRLAVVTRGGRPISRTRSVARAVVAATPALVWFIYLVRAPRVQRFVPTPGAPLLATGVVAGVFAIGLIWTIARRTRGPHDLLLGTWVIPR